MDAKATVRVRSATETVGDRPDGRKVQRTADLLAEQGFEVLRVGRYGVNVKANEKAFREVLGVEVKPDTAVVEAPKPRDAELSNLVDLVEVASPPTNFR